MYYQYPTQAQAMPNYQMPYKSPQYLPYQPTPYNQTPNEQPMGLKGRPVTSVDEVRGTIIDQDGSLFIFPDLGHNKIYTKQINIDGTATMNSFSLETPPQEEEKHFVELSQFAQVEQVVCALNNEITNLKQQIENLTTDNNNTTKRK